MQADIWSLYELMLRSRTFENAVKGLWEDGLISGEMHLGTGEEGVCAGIISQMQPGDALALDHRGTPPLLMRGVDPYLLLRELLGRPDGLCGGAGGHMHLFSQENLAASSGIVGASAPAAVGFALAAQMLRPGKLTVAFFGEGATNQGMLLEAFNLASAWKLPVIFVCKDNRWEITTPASMAISGQLAERAHAFGLQAAEVDGSDVQAVWEAARQAMQHTRQGKGPVFLHASCSHLDGHFLGDPFVQLAYHPVREMLRTAWSMLRSLFSFNGASLAERIHALMSILRLSRNMRSDLSRMAGADPLARTRSLLLYDPARLETLESSVRAEVQHVVQAATGAA
jgi:acetoin:2,6-dichlorophenolindophenol oxidoreductase subunit alpha